MRATLDVAQETTLFCMALYTLDPLNSNNSWVGTVLRHVAIPFAVTAMRTGLGFASSLLFKRESAAEKAQREVFANPLLLEMAQRMARQLKENPELMQRAQEAMQTMAHADQLKLPEAKNQEKPGLSFMKKGFFNAPKPSSSDEDLASELIREQNQNEADADALIQELGL